MEYLETHPWITFKADLERLSPHTWLMLGEIQSKCEHISKTPLKPPLAKALHQVYLAKGARATTAIEGNTLSEHEVEKLLQGKLTLPASKEYLQTEVSNIIAACNEIRDELFNDTAPCPITTDYIEGLNGKVLNNLPLDEHVQPGKIRECTVGVHRYRGAPWQECRYLLDRLCNWICILGADSLPGQKIAIAVLRAIITHVYIAWIHPFGDGNGRTARLLEFRLLLEAGVPTPAAHLLSNHYNETRSEYYRQLDLTSKKRCVINFIEYAVQGLLDQIRMQLNQINMENIHVYWKDYVYEVCGGRTETRMRQRELIIALSRFLLDAKGEVLSKKDLSNITPKIARLYAKKTTKTLTRDINWLQNHGLMFRHDGRYYPGFHVIFSFMPKRIGPSALMELMSMH
ncbi:Fic family protein [bacterium]|nr:Fic family protein [candidate division CSSED10-310 bacterium]